MTDRTDRTEKRGGALPRTPPRDRGPSDSPSMAATAGAPEYSRAAAASVGRASTPKRGYLIDIAGNVGTLALQDVGGLAAEHVQWGADGAPLGWRLLPLGKFRLTRDGDEFEGELSAEIAETMLAAAAAKGTPVPLDLHHNLKALADALGLDEDALARVLPQGVLTIGFGRLARRADGLWLEAVEWTDVGRKLIGAGLFRYFSPVIRGLADGRYRMTSVALTNSPALQGLDALAAEDGGTDRTDGTDKTDGGGRVLRMADLRNRAVTPKWKGEQMNKLLALVGRLIGHDCAALEDASKVPEPALTALDALATELPKLRLLAGTAGKVREALALQADAGEPQVLAALQGLQAKGQAHDSLKARVDTLALEAETNRRTKVVERGLAEGKLTPALVANWAKGQDAAALEAFLQHAPVVVTPGKTVDAGALPAAGDSLALTDADRKVAAVCGLAPAAVEKAMKERNG